MVLVAIPSISDRVFDGGLSLLAGATPFPPAAAGTPKPATDRFADSKAATGGSGVYRRFKITPVIDRLKAEKIL
jgi:hypothetical protein